MFANIAKYGLIGGLVVGIIDITMFVSMGDEPHHLQYGMLIGYTVMLVALSTVFLGIKRQRDHEQGGVIRFWPAFGMGVAISVIAGIFYVVAWEASQAISGADFASFYAQTMLEQARSEGKSAAELARMSAEFAQFKLNYANPMWRIPMIFTEIFPVGVLVSLISAALLRRPSFMPARRPVAALSP
jgi:hypothetical protein